MKIREKKWVILLIAVFSILLLTPVSANAASSKKVNVDKYLDLGEDYTVLVYNDSPTRPLKVYKKQSLTSGYYATYFNYGSAAVVATNKLKKGKKTAWIPIYMNNLKTKKGYKIGYLRAKYVKLDKIYSAQFSENKTIHKAIKTGFKYLGTPFKIPGSSLTSGIDCAQFVSAVYRIGGKRGLGTHTNFLQVACDEVFYHRKDTKLSKKKIKKLEPGDLLFYLAEDTFGPIDHVALYIGNGFMINSSGHYGSYYPAGGICIKRVQYGKRNIVRAMRLKGY